MATSWTLAWRNVCVSLHAPLLAENALVVIDRWIVQKWKPFHEKQDPYHLPNKNWNELIAPIGSKTTVFGGTETFLETQQIGFWIIGSVLVDWISFWLIGSIFVEMDHFLERIHLWRSILVFVEMDHFFEKMIVWRYGSFLVIICWEEEQFWVKKKYFRSNGSVFSKNCKLAVDRTSFLARRKHKREQFCPKTDSFFQKRIHSTKK